MGAFAKEDKNFIVCNQHKRKKDFCKVVRIKLEKKFSKYEKSEKQFFGISFWVKKWQK